MWPSVLTDTIIHANAYHHSVATEPRIEAHRADQVQRRFATGPHPHQQSRSPEYRQAFAHRPQNSQRRDHHHSRDDEKQSPIAFQPVISSPEDEASKVRPSVPIDANKAYWVAV